MAKARGMHRLLGACLGGVILTQAAPAASAFNLDYQVTGRIWIPSLIVEPAESPVTDRTVVLAQLSICDEQRGTRAQLLEPQDRDCRFERQLGEALRGSGLFPGLVGAAPPTGEVALVLEPRRSRLAFRRQVLSAVKPVIVLTLFTYLWTPLPFEVDVESYDLRLAILDPQGHVLSEVAVAREFTHYLSSYAAERTAPEELLAALEPAERDVAPVIVCRGPHAHLAVQELLQQVAVAVRTSQMPDQAGPRQSSGEGMRSVPGRARHLAAGVGDRGAPPCPDAEDDRLPPALCGGC